MGNVVLSYRETVDHIAKNKFDNFGNYKYGEPEHETYLRGEVENYGMIRIVAHIYDVPFMTVYNDVIGSFYGILDENKER